MKHATEVYGTVTMGTKGQIVVPMKARKALKIKPGDRLIAMSGPPGREEIISFVPVERISMFLQHFEARLSALKKELSAPNKK